VAATAEKEVVNCTLCHRSGRAIHGRRNLSALQALCFGAGRLRRRMLDRRCGRSPWLRHMHSRFSRPSRFGRLSTVFWGSAWQPRFVSRLQGSIVTYCGPRPESQASGWLSFLARGFSCRLRLELDSLQPTPSALSPSRLQTAFDSHGRAVGFGRCRRSGRSIVPHRRPLRWRSPHIMFVLELTRFAGHPESTGRYVPMGVQHAEFESLPPMVENISFQYAREAADKIRDAWLQLHQKVTESVLPWSG